MQLLVPSVTYSRPSIGSIIRNALSIALLLVASAASATTPPPLRNLFLPTAPPPQPNVIPKPPGARPPLWTPELVKGLGLSGPVTMDLLSHFPQAIPPGASGASDITSDASIHSHRLRPVSDTSVLGYTYPVTNDGPQDIEPAVITDTFYNPDNTSFYRTTSVWIKEEGTQTDPTPNLFWTSTTDFVNFAGYPLGQPLQTTHLSGTTRSADPMLSENPYRSLGVAPKRTYCSGVAYDQVNGQTGYTTVAVWFNDNPGTQQWQLFGGSPIASDNYPWFYDKPSIATSWYYPNTCCYNTLGWTYVAAIHANLNIGGMHIIELYLNTQDPMQQNPPNSQQTFQLINNQFSGTGYSSPIILVDSDSGYLYLLWVDLTARVINIAKSTNGGTNFSVVATITPPNPIICPTFDNNQINDTLFAQTAIMAKYNAVDKSIGVVWHNVENGSTRAVDVYFAKYGTRTGSLSAPIHIGRQPAGDPYNQYSDDRFDQWNPALDNDANGNYLVTWYDRRNDPQNVSYEVWATRVHADGTPIDSVDTRLYDARAAANTHVLPLLTRSGWRFMGDYQGVWEWYGTWYSATEYIAAGNQDIFMPRVSP